MDACFFIFFFIIAIYHFANRKYMPDSHHIIHFSVKCFILNSLLQYYFLQSQDILDIFM